MSTNSTSRRPFRGLFGRRTLCRLSGLLTLCWFTVATQALYAQNPVISLTLKNATVREVIEAVKTQSGYSFWYRESEIDLRKRVSVEAHDQNVLKLLDGVLADQGILAKLEGRHIVLYKSDPAGRGREWRPSRCGNDGPACRRAPSPTQPWRSPWRCRRRGRR